MANICPFLKTKADFSLFEEFYSDADLVRVPITSSFRLTSSIRKKNKLWVDLEFDGFHPKAGARSDSWTELMAELPNFSDFRDPKFLRNPKKDKVDQFVNALLDQTDELGARYVSVPQLPHQGEFKVTRINKAMARASAEWRSKKSRSIDFILPIILTKRDHSAHITKAFLDPIQSCFEESDAVGTWIVDESLDDQKGASTYQTERFPAMLKLSKELEKRVSARIRIAGPYWALNLVLWARGDITHPAVGIGNSYTYHITGGIPHNSSKVRLAIPNLVRWAVCGSQLEVWLHEAARKDDVNQPDKDQFLSLAALNRKVSTSSGKNAARRQIAEFYRDWIDSIESVQPDGRGVALFQQLSSAFVLGRKLKSMESENSAKQPEKIAEGLMTHCL